MVSFFIPGIQQESLIRKQRDFTDRNSLNISPIRNNGHITDKLYQISKVIRKNGYITDGL